MNQLYPLPLLAQRIISHNKVAKPQQTCKPILCFMAIHGAFFCEECWCVVAMHWLFIKYSPVPENDPIWLRLWETNKKYLLLH